MSVLTCVHLSPAVLLGLLELCLTLSHWHSRCFVTAAEPSIYL